MALSPASRNLWLYAAANAISRFGGQFQFLAVTAHTYAVTGSALATALQMAASSLPVILWARWAGIPADRYDPRRVTAVVSLVQAVLTLGYLLVDQVAWILLLNFLVSSAGVFLAPARAALLPQMVGREHLLQANARLATFNGAVQLLAPALAGTLLMQTGAAWAFGFNSISYLFPALAMAFVRPVEPRAVPAEPVAPGSRTALTFLRTTPGLLLLLTAYGAYALGMWSVNTIFYPYTKEVLGAGADVMGWSISFYFGAYTITGLTLERWGQRLRDHRLLVAGYLLGALVWVGYAFTRSVPVALLLSAFDGVVFTYALTLFETRVQEEAPPEARGRVFAVVRAYDEICTLSGQLMGGALATYVGIQAGLFGSAALTAGLLVAILGVRAAVNRRQRPAVGR